MKTHPNHTDDPLHSPRTRDIAPTLPVSDGSGRFKPIDRFVVISGCSGGGKSTLLAELQRRGHAVVPEPGRRIVQQETSSGGRALPWLDLTAFLHRAVAMALDDHAQAPRDRRWVFFDRSVVDAVAALQDQTQESLPAALACSPRYHRRVFLVPPWPEIYRQDGERRHGMAAALAEFKRLQRVYPQLGYTVTLLPKIDVAKRADFVMQSLMQDQTFDGEDPTPF